MKVREGLREKVEYEISIERLEEIDSIHKGAWRTPQESRIQKREVISNHSRRKRNNVIRLTSHVALLAPFAYGPISSGILPRTYNGISSLFGNEPTIYSATISAIGTTAIILLAQRILGSGVDFINNFFLGEPIPRLKDVEKLADHNRRRYLTNTTEGQDTYERGFGLDSI